MFANVGGQIKTFAKLYVWLETCIGVIIGGVIYSFIEKIIDPSAILCISLLIIGGGIGWLSGYLGAILFYAFGELVECVSDINEKLDNQQEEW